MRIQSKVLALLLPMFALPLLGLGTYVYWWQVESTTRALATQSMTNIERIETSLELRLAKARQTAKYVAKAPEAAALLSEPEPSAAQIAAWLKHLGQDTNVALVRVGPTPVRYSRNGAERLKTSASEPAWLHTFAQEPTRANVTVLHPEGTGDQAAAHVLVAVPFARQQGGPATYVTAQFPAAALMSAAQPAHAPAQSALLLLDSDRNTIARSGSLAVTPWRISPGELATMQTAAEFGAFADINYERLPLSALAQDLGMGLSAVLLIERATLVENARRVAWTAGVCTTLAVLLAALLVLGGLRRTVMLPLKRVKQAAQMFAEGDLATPLMLDSRTDEIGVLASTLEQMRRNLNESNRSAQRISNMDALTGLPNRRSMTERLDIEIARSRRDEGRSFALMFIDLDNFKAINDSMGHHAGDRLVIKVAQRLVEGLRAYDSVGVDRRSAPLDDDPSNFVARLGGDEFLVILNDITNANDCARVAERIYGMFAEPIYIDELQLRVSMSVGLAVYPDNGDSADELIQCADIAMYSAKTAGKNQYRFYDAGMDANARTSLEVETELRKALSEDGLALYYQPQIDLRSGDLIGCEALLRWHHESRGWISPAEFVPVAESCGLIHELGNWVLVAAFEQIKAWQSQGFDGPRVAVNLSSHQIASDGLKERVAELIGRYQVDPGRLEFELTETAIFGNREVAQRNLAGLRELGVHLALDDFGTGYSSLAWVRYCPVDIIKIDRSFVTDVQERRRHQAIIASVIELCRWLNLKTVAEGVETEAEVETLAKLGCDIAQGYLYARPLPPDEFMSFASQRAEQLAEASRAAATFPEQRRRLAS